MPKKPLLVIDIDGVINPFLSSEKMDAVDADDYLDPTHSHKSVRISTFITCYVRHDFPQMISKVRPHFELMWGTAWGAYQANTYMLRHLGLEFPLNGIDYGAPIPGKVEFIAKEGIEGLRWVGRQMPTFWKMPWIEQFAEESERPFVFIDDEVSPEAEEWASKRTEDGIPTLMIKTDDTIGWTDDHTTQLIEWAEGVKDGGEGSQTGDLGQAAGTDGAVG